MSDSFVVDIHVSALLWCLTSAARATYKRKMFDSTKADNIESVRRRNKKLLERKKEEEQKKKKRKEVK